MDVSLHPTVNTRTNRMRAYDHGVGVPLRSGMRTSKKDQYAD